MVESVKVTHQTSAAASVVSSKKKEKRTFEVNFEVTCARVKHLIYQYPLITLATNVWHLDVCRHSNKEILPLFHLPFVFLQLKLENVIKFSLS